jgi:hypothetical protein
MRNKMLAQKIFVLFTNPPFKIFVLHSTPGFYIEKLIRGNPNKAGKIRKNLGY